MQDEEPFDADLMMHAARPPTGAEKNESVSPDAAATTVPALSPEDRAAVILGEFQAALERRASAGTDIVRILLEARAAGLPYAQLARRTLQTRAGRAPSPKELEREAVRLRQVVARARDGRSRVSADF